MNNVNKTKAKIKVVLLIAAITVLAVILSRADPGQKVICHYDIYQGGKVIDKKIDKYSSCRPSHTTNGVYLKLIYKDGDY